MTTFLSSVLRHGVAVCATGIAGVVAAAEKTDVRAAIPRAESRIVIDGRLIEYSHALCTPVEYFHPDLPNRAGQFFYLWDDDAIYVAVRTLDKTPFTPSENFWVGDAVEWYLDVRRGADFRSAAWGPGSVHCFFAGAQGNKIAPQFSKRPGYEDLITGEGVQVASRRTDAGLEVEFKLPWRNFPAFRPAVGEVIAIDAELSYSDGVTRDFRTFAFGGPLSVEQPANLAPVKLVDKLRQCDWRTAAPVLFPMRIDVPWNQKASPVVEAWAAVPPHVRDKVGRIAIELRATDGSLLGAFDADHEEVFEPTGGFVRRRARWPVSFAGAGDYLPVAVIYGRDGVEIGRSAPRLTSVNMTPGY